MPSTPKETTSTQISKVELPPWVDQAAQDNLKFAGDVAGQPYRPYYGPLTAGSNDNLGGATQYATAASDGLNDNGMGQSTAIAGQVGSSTPGQVNYGANAPSTMSSLLNVNGNYTPQQVQAQQIAGPLGVKDVTAKTGLGGIDDYYNPYEKQVVQSAQDAGQQSIAASQRANSDNAIAAGAFGSSRHGVTEGVTAAEGARDISQTVAGVRSAGYTQALSALQGDNARVDAASMANQNSALTTQGQLQAARTANAANDLTAQQNNQGAGLTANAQRIGAETTNAGNRLAAASTDASTALAQQQGLLAASTANAANGLSANAAKLQAAGILSGNATATGQQLSTTAGQLQMQGLAEQAQEQQGDQAAYGQFQNEVDYPTQQLNLRLAALGMTPYGKTTTTDGTSTTSGGDNPFLTGLGGLTSLFSFSDPKLKKNVKKVGKGPNGMNLHEFEYKDSFRKTPAGALAPKGKLVGLMADEVEKKMPGAVKKVPIGNGKTAKAVNYPMALAPKKKGGLFSFGGKAA